MVGEEGVEISHGGLQGQHERQDEHQILYFEQVCNVHLLAAHGLPAGSLRQREGGKKRADEQTGDEPDGDIVIVRLAYYPAVYNVEHRK